MAEGTDGQPEALDFPQHTHTHRDPAPRSSAGTGRTTDEEGRQAVSNAALEVHL